MLKNTFTVLNLIAVLTGCSLFEESPGSGKSKHPDGPELLNNPVSLDMQLASYDDCRDLQESIRKDLVAQEEVRRENLRRQKEFYEKFSQNNPQAQYAPDLDPSGFSGDSGDNSTTTESFTNVQEKGIDEPDFIKIGQKQIFILRKDSIVVADRSSLAELGIIKLERPATKIFYHAGKIVLIGSRQGYFYDNAVAAQYDAYYNENAVKPSTYVEIYSEQDKKLPVLEKSYELEANYVDSRLKDGRLILVSNSSLPFKKDFRKVDENEDYYTQYYHYSDDPIEINEELIRTVPCNKIVRRVANDDDYSMIVVSTLDLNKTEITIQTNATLGAGQDFYMGPEGLYIAKPLYQTVQYWNGEDVSESEIPAPDYIITKARLTTDEGYPVFTARGAISGYTKDQYSFKEYPNVDGLAVITTSDSQLVSGAYEDAEFVDKVEGRNHLFVMQEEEGELKIRKVIKNFGKPGEDIRSARFEKDRAYAVTFKKTDPLYAFNMREPLNPQLEGELEVPGFSSYLHPLDDRLLIGIGFDAADQGDFAFFQGIQVSLFDVANSQQMNRLDNIVLGKRGSSSEVTHDAHAFFIDQENSLFALPVVLLAGEQSYDSQYGNKREFSGAIFYRVENDQLQEAKRVSHYDLIPQSCRNELSMHQWWQSESVSADVNRIFDVDERYLTISRFGIVALEKSGNLNVTRTVRFSADYSGCTDQIFYH